MPLSVRVREGRLLGSGKSEDGIRWFLERCMYLSSVGNITAQPSLLPTTSISLLSSFAGRKADLT